MNTFEALLWITCNSTCLSQTRAMKARSHDKGFDIEEFQQIAFTLRRRFFFVSTYLMIRKKKWFFEAKNLKENLMLRPRRVGSRRREGYVHTILKLLNVLATLSKVNNWIARCAHDVEQSEQKGTPCVYRFRTQHPYEVVFNSSQLSRYCFHCWSIRDIILLLCALFLDKSLH